jgi:hypothetical protein
VHEKVSANGALRIIEKMLQAKKEDMGDKGKDPLRGLQTN